MRSPSGHVVGSWPYGGDSPIARARRVAQGYRARLDALDPASCAELDRLFADLGERWVAPRLLTVADDDTLTAAEAADLAGVSLNTVRVWRARGRLTGEQDARGSWRYRAGDVIELISNRRRRRGRAGQSGP
jgi:Helix-turn-helix domain